MGIVSAGGAVASFTLPNYITKLQDVHVKRGKTNNFAIDMMPGTMTKEAEEGIKAQFFATKAAKKAKRKSKKAVSGATSEVKATEKEARIVVVPTVRPKPSEEV